jgi:CBS domain-containing protein
MLKAKDIMSKTVTTIRSDGTLLDAIQLLVCKEISGLPVVDERGKMIGIITEKDILNFVFSGNLKNTRVADVMSKDVVSFSPETSVDTIALAVGQNKFRRVPIVEGDKVVGIVSRRDIIRSALDLHCKL